MTTVTDSRLPRYRRFLKYFLVVLVLLPLLLLFFVYYPSHVVPLISSDLPVRRSGDHLMRPRRTADGRLLEIRLGRKAFVHEGIGASLSGLKPILMMANATGAAITADGEPDAGAHKYNLRHFIEMGRPILKPKTRRICQNTEHFFWEVIGACESYNYTALIEMFKTCEVVYIKNFLGHPRNCIAHTAPLVRRIFKYPPLKKIAARNDLCVLRRGGDVEDRIEAGHGNHYGIDEKLTIPLLDIARRYLMEVVVVTETKHPLKLRMQYGHPLTLSNKEPIGKVHQRLSHCRCLFVSSGSSFAVAMVQLTNPTTLIYTVNHPGFRYKFTSFNFSDYGHRAIPMTTPRKEIIRRCVNRKTKWRGLLNFFTCVYYALYRTCPAKEDDNNGIYKIPTSFKMAIKIKTLILIFFAAFASVALSAKTCARPKTVRKFIGLWRPNAIKFGICEKAIKCVKRKMMNAVRCGCLTDEELGSFQGASTPDCFESKCL